MGILTRAQEYSKLRPEQQLMVYMDCRKAIEFLSNKIIVLNSLKVDGIKDINKVLKLSEKALEDELSRKEDLEKYADFGCFKF